MEIEMRDGTVEHLPDGDGREGYCGDGMRRRIDGDEDGAALPLVPQLADVVTGAEHPHAQRYHPEHSVVTMRKIESITN